MRETYEKQATHTRVRVSFFSHDADGYSGTLEGGSDPLGGSVVSVNTTKAMGNAAGNFTIQIKKPQQRFTVGGDLAIPLKGSGEDSYLRLWNDPEGTWVRIDWLCDGQVIDGMVGIIDTVNEQTAFTAKGQRTEVYNIVGSDFGKVFQQTLAFVNVYDNSASLGLVSLYQRLSGNIDGAPGKFVEALLEAWIGNYSATSQPWFLPDGLPTPGRGAFYDYLQRRIGCKDEAVHGYLADATLLNVEQDGKNLWSLLQQYANLLMNELIVDLAPPADGDPEALSGLVPTITLRPKPFKVKNDHVRWDQLRNHTLEPSDMQSRKLAKGGPAQRFNYWIIDVGGQQGVEVQAILQERGNEPGLPGSVPIWNLKSIENHGFRLWKQTTDFLPITTSEGDGDWIGVAGNWLRRCHDWHCVATRELSGTLMTSRLRPEIRIGQKVTERRAEGEIEYYVEAVTNSWAMGGAGTTQLSVTRGEYVGEDLLGQVYEELGDRTPRTRISLEVDASGEITGEGLTDEDDNSGLVSEDAFLSLDTGEESPALDEALQLVDDFLSPSEADARRAHNGEREQTVEDPTQTEQAQSQETPEDFGQEELENGEEIPADFNDPLAGLDDEGNIL